MRRPLSAWHDSAISRVRVQISVLHIQNSSVSPIFPLLSERSSNDYMLLQKKSMKKDRDSSPKIKSSQDTAIPFRNPNLNLRLGR